MSAMTSPKFAIGQRVVLDRKMPAKVIRIHIGGRATYDVRTKVGGGVFGMKTPPSYIEEDVRESRLKAAGGK
jgi:hypothetical protein